MKDYYMAGDKIPDSPKPNGGKLISRREKLIWNIIMLMGVVLTVIIGIYAYNRNLQSLTIKLEKDALLHLSLLQSELDKQSGLPMVLADDVSIQNLLKNPVDGNAIHVSQNRLWLRLPLKE
jgi:C4-dicarboxylate-specific signal transduction histidine kinase